jgi:hypothetical protein
VEIFCACPFPVATLAWEPAASRASVTVCVKATFVLVPGVATLAPLQEAIRLEGTSADAPDLVPYKPRADILLAGHAHAPGGAPTDSLLARARVGGWRKSLSINGDRTWVPSFDGLRPSVAVPFRRMPLVYERAVRTGENLMGVDISQGAENSRPLANIAAIADQGGETPGLAPIPFGWRALHLALGDAGILWASRAGVLAGPPPEGFDFRIFNAAPIEQQVDEIPPGASVLLENLHPEFGQLETRLPWLLVKLFLRGPGDAPRARSPCAAILCRSTRTEGWRSRSGARCFRRRSPRRGSSSSRRRRGSTSPRATSIACWRASRPSRSTWSLPSCAAPRSSFLG